MGFIKICQQSVYFLYESHYSKVFPCKTLLWKNIQFNVLFETKLCAWLFIFSSSGSSGKETFAAGEVKEEVESGQQLAKHQGVVQPKGQDMQYQEPKQQQQQQEEEPVPLPCCRDQSSNHDHSFNNLVLCISSVCFYWRNILKCLPVYTMNKTKHSLNWIGSIFLSFLFLLRCTILLWPFFSLLLFNKCEMTTTTVCNFIKAYNEKKFKFLCLYTCSDILITANNTTHTYMQS